MALQINDTNRDGTLQIMDTSWDSNGTLMVTIRDNIGTGCRVGGIDIRAMRRLARRAISHPEQTRSSRVVRQFTADGCDYVTFAVSRLPS
jgi:hypothetical protein